MEVIPRVLAQVVRRFLPRYREKHRLNPDQRKAVRAIVRCKTPALGGHEYECDHCGHRRTIYHGCRNRHCPECQGLKSRDWLEKQGERLLPIRYYHAVFTVAAEVRLLFAYNRRKLYGLLFEVSAQTLQEFGADPRWLGARMGLIGILHTWGQQLAFHPHIHYIVTGGGMDAAGRWVWPRQAGEFLFPVVLVSQVFREKLLRRLERLHQKGELNVPPGLEVEACLEQARSKKWEVYLQPPVAGPKKLLKYLGRYTHRVAMNPARIRWVSEQAVCFGYRDYRCGGVEKEMVLAGEEFLGRFLEHVVPRGFRRIRQYGIFCARKGAEGIEAVREQLIKESQALLAALSKAREEPVEEPTQGPECPVCGEKMRMGRAIAACPMDSS